MPLMKSKSKKAFKHNVEAEMSAGKPQKQALAIAYATKRRMAKGGMVMPDERGIGPLNEEDKASPKSREDQYQHDKDMREAAHRDGLHSFAHGGEVGGGPADDEELMEGDAETFLSDEEHSTPFHSIEYDQSESSGLFDDNSMDNEEGNEDQNAARAGIMERIMRKVRMRNMGK
jgi:hypothetical protein